MEWLPLRRALGKLERYVARRRGYDLLQLTLRDLLLGQTVDLVLDVGANHGQYRDLLRGQVGYNGSILSFEPVPPLAAELRRRGAGDREWRIVEAALGDREGRADLQIMHGDDFSSQLTPSEYGSERFPTLLQPESTVSVTLRRLDKCLPDLQPDWAGRRIHLKIDTQGSDAAVLDGAGDVLPAIRTLQLELAFQRLYEGVPRAHELLARLEGLGFDPCGFYSVAGRDAGRLIEADCVLVNRRFAGGPAPRDQPPGR